MNKNTKRLISELVNNKNALINKLTEIHINKKILDSELQMKNYIRFFAYQTLGSKMVV